MVTTSTSSTSSKDGGIRGIAAVGLAATVVVLLFVWIVGASMSAPKAHGLTFGLVGPPAAVATVEGAIAHADPGGFTTSSYPDEAAARRALERQDIHGALVLGRGNDLLLVTGASGDATKQADTTVGDKIAATSKAQLTITDIAPLPNGDQHGLLAFTVMVAATLAGLVFQLLLSLRYPRLGRTRWLLSAIVFSAVAGLGAASVADLGIGAFGGELWPVAGVAALLTLVSVVHAAAGAAGDRDLGRTGPPGVPPRLLPGAVPLHAGLGRGPGGPQDRLPPGGPGRHGTAGPDPLGGRRGCGHAGRVDPARQARRGTCDRSRRRARGRGGGSRVGLGPGPPSGCGWLFAQLPQEREAVPGGKRARTTTRDPHPRAKARPGLPDRHEQGRQPP
jgi:hypothetical protein